MKRFIPAISVAVYLLPLVALGQLTLPSMSYTQNFDAIGSGLPEGWSVRTGASSSSLGSTASLTTAATTWADTGGAFKNFASATGLNASSSNANQSASTNRALGVRPSGSVADPGGAFTLQLANTTGKSAFSLSFDAMMLDVQARSQTWSLQYGVGTSPSSFTTLATYTDPGTWGTTNFSIASSALTGIENQSQNVWIRIVNLSASTGSGSRDSFAIDNFSLSYTSAAQGTFWDANGNTAGIGGSGTWSSTGTTFATTSDGTTVATGDTSQALIFDGTGGTVSVSGTVSPAKGFDVKANGYTFTGGTAIALAGTSIANNKITVDPSVSTTIATPLSGSNGLTKDGGGTLILSTNNPTFTGGLSILGGTLRLGTGRFFDSTNAVTFANTAGATLDLNGNSQTISTLSGGGASGGEIALGGATLTVGSSSSSTFGGTVTGAGNFIKVGTGTLTLSQPSSYTGTTTVRAGTLQLSSVANVLPASTALTLGDANAATSGGILNLNGQNLSVGSLTLVAPNSSTTRVSGSGILTVNGDINYVSNVLDPGNDYPVTLAATTLDLGNSTRAFNIAANNNASTGDLIVSSVIRNGGIEYNGSPSGTYRPSLQFTGANTFNGGLTVSLGVLNVSPSGTLGAATNALTITASGTSSVNNSTVNLSSAQTIGSLAGGTVSGTALAQLNLGSTGGLTINQSTSTTFGGILSGSAPLRKSGAGTLTLTGVNINTGITTLTGGTLSVATIGNGGVASNLGQAASGAANIVFDGGTLAYTGATAESNRAFTINSDKVATIDVAANTLTLPGATGTATTGSLTKSGAGTLVLSGTNSFTGLATISDGVLQVTGSLANSSDVLVNGGTYQVASSDTIDSVTLKQGTIAGNGLLTADAIVEAGQVTARLTGTGRTLTKVTAGVVTLTAANTYTGDTTVQAGRLTLASTGSIQSDVYVSGNAILQVDGVVDGSVLIDSEGSLTGTGTITADALVDGALSPGASAGTLSVLGNLDFGATSQSTMEIESPSSFDQALVGGTLEYGGTLNIPVSGSLESEQSFDLFNFTTGMSAGTFSAITISGNYNLTLNVANSWSALDGSGLLFAFDHGAGSLVLSAEAVPEPLTAGGVLLLASRVLGRRQRATI